MSAAHRSLARLPLEIFENLIAVSSHNNNNKNAARTLMTTLSEENEEEYDKVNGYNGDNAAAAAASASVDPAILLREAICQKLKAIPPSKQMPHRRKSLRQTAAAAAAATATAVSATETGNTTTSTSAIHNNATTLSESIQAVGPLLFMSKTALLRALDPLLTFGAFVRARRLVYIVCMRVRECI
jgi:hypothetical protein